MTRQVRDAGMSQVEKLPHLVDENEIARIIGMSLAWVRKDRRTKRVIPFTRLGAAIRYNPQQVLIQLDAQSEGGVASGKGGRR